MDVDRLIERLLKIESCSRSSRCTSRRYELTPFRRRRQHATTIMLRVKRSFLDETFLPQFNALEAELTRHLDEVAQTIIEAAVHRDLTEAAEVEEPKQLSMAID